MKVVIQTTEEVTSGEVGITTVIDAITYEWYYGYFLVYTNTLMNYFHISNLESITVDGYDIPIPVIQT